MELRYSARAERDLHDGSVHRFQSHPSRSSLFDETLADALTLLLQQPRMGRATRRYKNGRVLVLPEIEHLLF